MSGRALRTSTAEVNWQCCKIQDLSIAARPPQSTTDHRLTQTSIEHHAYHLFWARVFPESIHVYPGERRDRASRAWKVVGQIKERVVLPEVRNWHGKASIFGQSYSQGVWGLRFVKRTREDQLHRPRCKGFAQAPCPVSRPTGRVHIIGHQSRLHRKSIQSTRISELDGVQSGVKESVRQ